VLATWKEHFEEHLNDSSGSEQPTRPVNLRDDGVDIDLPSREKIEGPLKYIIIINRMIAEECTEYLIPSQIDVQLRQVLDRLWSSLM
jgi:hypothetical protein